MNFGDGINIEDVVIPEFKNFVELDPLIKDFENEIKRRYWFKSKKGYNQKRRL